MKLHQSKQVRDDDDDDDEDDIGSNKNENDSKQPRRLLTKNDDY